VNLSVAGLIGAAVGLGVGYIDYRILTGVVVGRLRKLDTSSTPAERETFERKIRVMRILFAVMTVGAFPVIGYVLGTTIAGG
jgi:hypothetical protein